MCQLNAAHVTYNVIIFTSLGCVISHHNGPYHPKQNRRSGLTVFPIARTRTVRDRKQEAWEQLEKIGGTVPVRHYRCRLRRQWLGSNSGSGQEKWKGLQHQRRFYTL